MKKVMDWLTKTRDTIRRNRVTVPVIAGVVLLLGIDAAAVEGAAQQWLQAASAVGTVLGGFYNRQYAVPVKKIEGTHSSFLPQGYRYHAKKK